VTFESCHSRVSRLAASAVVFVVVIAAGSAAGNANSVAPPPCTGALPIYTPLGTLSAVDGSHRRTADVEARLAILTMLGGGRGTRVGWAYVDEEGDVWVSFDPRASRARAAWRRVAPGINRHAPVYALLERLGIPRGYSLTTCAP
jgi:hypothetical protein